MGDLKKDFEYNQGCYGFYHGGHSTNVCANKNRIHYRIKHSEVEGRWDGKRIGVLVDFENCKLYIMHSGKVWSDYSVDIAQDTSYYFHFWLHCAGDNVIIYPPRPMDCKQFAELKLSKEWKSEMVQ